MKEVIAAIRKLKRHYHNELFKAVGGQKSHDVIQGKLEALDEVMEILDHEKERKEFKKAPYLKKFWTSRSLRVALGDTKE